MKKCTIELLLIINLLAIFLHILWKERLLTLSVLEYACQELEEKLMRLEKKLEKRNTSTT